MYKITLIILNWNGKKDTLGCLESLEKISTPVFETVVVDNGSQDDSVEAIGKLFPHIKLIETGENLGFAGGNNVGIQYALDQGADFIFLLNNDTVVDPQILMAFVQSMKKNPQAGILGAKTYLYESRSQFDHFGGIWNKKKGNFDLIGNRVFDDGQSWEEEKELDYVCGCAFFVRREVFEKIGLLEPRFFLIWEESDFCMRAKRAGFLTLTCPKAKIWHKVSASFASKAHASYFWWRNRLLWIERNCTGPEKIFLAFRVLIPEIFKLFKLKVLKSVQNAISPCPHREDKLKRYRASLQGVKDYIWRRFGNGPSWIYK